MSQAHVLMSITREAENDLSSKQFYIVEPVSSNRVDVCDSQGERAIGVLQNKPEATLAANIAILGTSKVISHDTGIVAGSRLTTDANGKAELAASGDFVIGIALEAAAAENDIIEMVIERGSTPFVS